MSADDLGPLRAGDPNVIDAEFRVVRGRWNDVPAERRREPLFKPRSREPMIKSWGGVAKFGYWLILVPIIAGWIASHGAMQAHRLLWGPHS